MADRSAIEWTQATWNPVTGRTKVSAGCKNCYALAFAERWRGVGVIIDANKATGDEGGGIVNDGVATLSLTKASISGNVAAARGGGIANQNSATATLKHTRINDNTAANQDGGIYNTANGTVTLTNDDTVNDNTPTAAASHGGGICTDSGAMATLKDTSVERNAAVWGAGIYSVGTLTLTDAEVNRNAAAVYGGGIWTDGTPTLVHCIPGVNVKHNFPNNITT